MTRRTVFAGLLIGSLLAQSAAWGQSYTLPPGSGDLMGISTQIPVRAGQTLSDIARDYSIGWDEIVGANPKVDPWLPGAGTDVVIPSRYILPNAPRQGVVINLPEMRLYYFHKPYKTGAQRVDTFPVSIGRMDWKSPLGATKIASKQKDPPWYPPESIREEHAAKGDPLPKMVPAGPNNPLGQFALRLGVEGYLIHGTDKPYGIGMQVTHGCMRLYPEDIETVFNTVQVNTPVQIVNQHVKVGWSNGTLYIQVRPQLPEFEMPREDAMSTAIRLVSLETNDTLPANFDWTVVKKAVDEARGVPVAIWSRTGYLEASFAPSARLP